MMARASDSIDLIADLREQKGWTVRRIAEHIGCSVGAVTWQCLINNIEKPGQGRFSTLQPGATVMRSGHRVRTFSADEDRRLIAMEAQGMNYSQIGRELGRRPNSIRGRLATLARIDARASA